jgi:hypothetical protein
MSVFDLAFLVVFLATVISALTAGVVALRGRRDRARRIWRRAAAAVAVYFAILLGVAIASPQRFTALKATQCSDDWCIAPDSVSRIRTATAETLAVRFSLSSRARRAAQRERFVVVYLRTADRKRIDPLSEPTTAPFDTLLLPGETVQTWRRFVVPPSASGLGLVIAREGGFRFPGCCIIGDESSFLHKRTLTPLD